MALESLMADVEEVAINLDDGYSDDPNLYSDQKVIRDAIWDFHDIPPEYLTILDSPFLQRLRFLSQTAFTISTYPCSQHSRFEHTLGVFNATEKMLSSLESSRGSEIEEPYRTETKIAALLHDIGHGPFSHASETVYGRNDVFDIDDTRFLDAVPSEVLSYCLIKSSPLEQILDTFRSQSEHDLDDLSDERISDMILGNEEGLPENYRFLRYIVNGPFDADKLDYINRDGYFTGLEVTLDVERLLQGLEISDEHDIIIMSSKSLSALEQVYIGKSQLYSQVYHHHKIRAAAALIHELFHRLQTIDAEIQEGFDFNNPATYLKLDENDILGGSWDDDQVNEYIDKLRRRDLPQRALVITYSCLPDIRKDDIGEEEREIANNWGNLRSDLKNNIEFLREEERRIGEESSSSGGRAFIDIPSNHPGASKTDPPLIRMGSHEGPILEMSEVFPAESWANAYEFYRERSYIFTDAEQDEIPRVTEGILNWLESHDVKVNPLAVRDAKISPNELDWSHFLPE